MSVLPTHEGAMEMKEAADYKHNEKQLYLSLMYYVTGTPEHYCTLHHLVLLALQKQGFLIDVSHANDGIWQILPVLVERISTLKLRAKKVIA